MLRACAIVLTFLSVSAQTQEELYAKARGNGTEFQRAVAASDRLMKAWLTKADVQTLLLPDRIGGTDRVYTPHNSGADLYPYLILTANLTNPELYRGRMMEMLRNEIRYTTHASGIPGNYDLATRQLGPPSLFGAGEYAKDGLLTVTELLGRTPWFARMVDMTEAAMRAAPVESRHGMLPAKDAELNGDFLQVLVRLAAMTNERQFLHWARRIGDAYVREVLPGNGGLPSMEWDFTKHTGDGKLKLRDHGNEIVVGLTLLLALERDIEGERQFIYAPVVGKMLDRILASANRDGMLYNMIDARTLKPLDERLSDNWGYIYGAMYAYYQATGEPKYREAVRRVLANLPKYRNYCWEPSGNARDKTLGSFDGYADAIESAIYLVNREPVPEALDWIDSEMKVMLDMQRADGHVEDWYGEGNFNRTALLYALMKSQGVRPEAWTPGLNVGAVRSGEGLLVSIRGNGKWRGRVQFDFARHRRVMNFARNYVRLNEFPEWFTVDENRIYRVSRRDASSTKLLLGSELIQGVEFEEGEWVVQP